MTNDQHIVYINYVANEDAEGLVEAEKSYAGSWKKRGGVGAFMMLARKWDRLDARAEKHGWDIFDAIAQDERAEGVIDDIRDLRRYLMLVEAEMIARGAVGAQTPHRDNAEKTLPPASRTPPLLPRECTAKEYEDLAPVDQKKYEFKNGRYWLAQVHYGDRASR